MTARARDFSWRGPFRADQIRAGDPYELSRGHTIECLPTGARGGRANLIGGSVLDTDPAVESAGVDTGFSPEPGTMRAPDIAVGNVPDAPGWVKGVPPLAVEYADVGQDERDLQVKIAELLDAGTRFIWVVRLTGPRRVEVYEPGARVRTVLPGEMLTAPDILKNPIPIEALYDREAAHRVTFRNLLQREGYESLEAVKSEGREEGREEGECIGLRRAIRDVLSAKGLSLDPAHEARVEACSDVETLRRWLRAAAVATDATGVLG